MVISDFLSKDGVIPHLKATSKKQILQDIAALIAPIAKQNERDIFEALLQRERLGSTGLGEGVALPHGKLPKLDKLTGLFARLEKPVAFDALDGNPVDLVFLLLAPETAGADHLKALARVARIMRDPALVFSLRKTIDRDELYSLLTQNS